MDTSTPASETLTDPRAPQSGRQRDADGTRQLLLAAARRRFARDGYSSTTVRDIASDVGVNVALINRYFASKEGLFEACLNAAVKNLDQADRPELTVDDMVRTMVSHIAGPPTGERPFQLLLLLRSSGDAGADAIRHRTLRSVAERMAGVAGWDPADADTAPVMLRAQVALSTALGIVVLRSSSTGLEPLSSGSSDDLAVVLGEVFSTLLAPR